METPEPRPLFWTCVETTDADGHRISHNYTDQPAEAALAAVRHFTAGDDLQFLAASGTGLWERSRITGVRIVDQSTGSQVDEYLRAGLLSSASTHSSGEGNPERDLGPYESREQVLAQISAQLHGAPDPGPGGRASLLLAQAFLLAGIAPTFTDYERDQAASLAQVIGPVGAQQIAAWILRAYLQGDRSRAVTEQQDD